VEAKETKAWRVTDDGERGKEREVKGRVAAKKGNRDESWIIFSN